jgi:hypothetical protein
MANDTETLEELRARYFKFRNQLHVLDETLPKESAKTREVWESRIPFIRSAAQELHEMIVGRERRLDIQDIHAAMAQEEPNLKPEERNAYADILNSEVPTKGDLHRLEAFHAQSWSRLSESGKGELSHLLWEGIRRQTFRFCELPRAVRNDERLQVLAVMKDEEKQASTASEIPEEERNALLQATEQGDRLEAEYILSGQVFGEGMFQTSDSQKKLFPERHRAEEDHTREASAAEMLLPAVQKIVQAAADRVAELDLSQGRLNGVKVVAATTRVTAAAIPESAASRAKEAQPVPER